MNKRYVVLTGGIGGAKLVAGLARVLDPEQLTVIVNTGDDFTHFGLHISPDIDTLIYTLADIVNPQTGWGLAGESWNFMAAIEKLGGQSWFRLGDRDLATHAERTRALAAGETLSAVTRQLCSAFGLQTRILPMSDQQVATQVETDRGLLDFQHYFVRERAAPAVRALHYRGAESASAAAGVRAALEDPQLAGIIIAPSNPWLSIGPMLAIPDISSLLRESPAPVIAVSPIVAGAAIKGPTAKIMRELGLPVSAAAVAQHYRKIADGFILDRNDEQTGANIAQTGMTVACTDTVMVSMDKKEQLARFTIDFLTKISG